MDILTRESLAEMLKGVNVEQVAKAAGVSAKTIYRIRQGARNAAGDEISPTLDTARAIVAAIKAVKAAEAQAALDSTSKAAA